MERNKIIKIIILINIISIGSCNFLNQKKQGFYDYSRISYIYRLPLVEPYEIMSSDNGETWTLDFKTLNPPTKMGVQFLSKVGINKSVIVVYSKRDFSYSPDNPGLWSVINTITKDENIFLTENDYENYLKTQRIKDIKLYEINQIFKIFEEENKLPLEWGRQPK